MSFTSFSRSIWILSGLSTCSRASGLHVASTIKAPAAHSLIDFFMIRFIVRLP